MADYLQASGEDQPDMTVEILVDGRKRKEVRITAENLFTFDNKFVLEGDAVAAGERDDRAAQARARGRSTSTPT